MHVYVCVQNMYWKTYLKQCIHIWCIWHTIYIFGSHFAEEMFWREIVYPVPAYVQKKSKVKRQRRE